MTTLTYRITENHVYGNVLVFAKGVANPIAEKSCIWCLRRTPAVMAADVAGLSGASGELGILVKRLPTGVTVKDVCDAYQIARDELADAGVEIPFGQS